MVSNYLRLSRTNRRISERLKFSTTCRRREKIVSVCVTLEPAVSIFRIWLPMIKSYYWQIQPWTRAWSSLRTKTSHNSWASHQLDLDRNLKQRSFSWRQLTSATFTRVWNWANRVAFKQRRTVTCRLLVPLLVESSSTAVLGIAPRLTALWSIQVLMLPMPWPPQMQEAKHTRTKSNQSCLIKTRIQVRQPELLHLTTEIAFKQPQEADPSDSRTN